ncbi:MAG: c-type cytochrome [Acidobacteriia bacterium]|nr:c-type cytochrome [Terriglobia bacterium]
MKLLPITVLISAALVAGCKQSGPPPLKPAAYGTQITEVSGGKQLAQVGSTLPQPLVLQVNGADGNPVTGALVSLHGDGLQFNPVQKLTDSSGQVTVEAQLGFNPGDYQVIAETPKSGGGSATLNLREIALGYEQAVGKAVNDQYCIRCHDPESTPERVSNLDNLSPAPHQFTDGGTLNRMSDADLTNMIAHGGPALGKSPQMPAYAATLKPAEIKAVLSYIRTVADPPYQTPGVKYGK